MYAEFFVNIFTPKVNKKEGADLKHRHLSLFQSHTGIAQEPSKYCNYSTALENSTVTLSAQVVEQSQQ